MWTHLKFQNYNNGTESRDEAAKKYSDKKNRILPYEVTKYATNTAWWHCKKLCKSCRLFPKKVPQFDGKMPHFDGCAAVPRPLNGTSFYLEEASIRGNTVYIMLY